MIKSVFDFISVFLLLTRYTYIDDVESNWIIKAGHVLFNNIYFIVKSVMLFVCMLRYSMHVEEPATCCGMYSTAPGLRFPQGPRARSLDSFP